ncbi:Terpenoid synthase [Penicillium occitanis (nom. inval.)]|nr:Terpenoid synthase [Penicillium occitanis (nom. inval.)]PCH02065.1 hypothetical protein PENOC_045440 [Penicillium occitanis (nom. inval.)]
MSAMTQMQSHQTSNPQVVDSTVDVVLPELFRLFLSEQPRVNPHYDLVKKESEAWFVKECQLGDHLRRILDKTDFSYFCAVAVPDAGRIELRTLCDWGNWVFPFDDLFDNGALKDDPYKANSVINALLSDMGRGVGRNICTNGRDQLPSHSQALLDVHKSVWRRIVQSSSVGVQDRFADSIRDYLEGTIRQVYCRSRNQNPTFEETFAMRRGSAGVSPLFALAEYALKLDLPDKVFENESIKEIQRIGVDFVVIHNDILSYCKEEAEEVPHNLVAITRYQMQSFNRQSRHAQDAFDIVGNILSTLYKRWFLALAELPSWGERVDADVQKYIATVRAIVMANLNWRQVFSIPFGWL